MQLLSFKVWHFWHDEMRIYNGTCMLALHDKLSFSITVTLDGNTVQLCTHDSLLHAGMLKVNILNANSVL